MSGLFAPPQDVLFAAAESALAQSLPEWTVVEAIDTGTGLPEKVIAIQTQATEDTNSNAAWGDDDYRWWTLTVTVNAVAPTDGASATIMALHKFFKSLRGRRFEFSEGVALIRTVTTLQFFSPTGQYALSGGKQLTQEVGQYQITMEV